MTPSIVFVPHASGRVLGRAWLVDGRLVSDSTSVQNIIDGKCWALDMSGLQAAEFFASWSNGYVSSSIEDDPAGEKRAALEGRPTRTIGIDLAAAPAGTAIVAIDWGAEAIAHLESDAADSTAVLQALATGDKVGIDCPFGWPTDFVDAVVAHQARQPWPGGADVADRRALRLRATDRHLRDQYKVNPLSVSTDRIGSVAMRWASLVSSHEQVHGPIDRTGAGRLIEVYPALALRQWGLRTRATTAYKKARGSSARQELLSLLTAKMPNLLLDAELRAAADDPTHGHDVVDALLAALVAAASATPGLCEEPPPWSCDDGQRARVEGWIAVPTGPPESSAPRRGPFFRPPGF